MSAYLSLIGRRRGGRLFEAERLLTFSAFRMGAYSRWALIRINKVVLKLSEKVGPIFSSFNPFPSLPLKLN